MSRLGPLFAAGLVGLMVGAFAVGPLADRHGRKAMLTASMVVFGLASLASSFSGDLWTLTWLASSRASVSAAPCLRASRWPPVPAPHPGGVARDADVLWLHDRIGAWRPHRVPGDRTLRMAAAARRRRVAPLALAPVLWWTLPESLRYLVMAGARGASNRHGALEDCAKRRSRRCDLHRAKAPAISPVRQLFSGGLMTGTLLLWLAFFMSLLVVYLLSNWMPTLDPAKHRCLAEPCRTDYGDVADRRHGRRDRRRPNDGRPESSPRARRRLCRWRSLHRFDQHDDSSSVADGARGLRCGILRLGRAGRRECALRGLLSHALSRHRRELGKRDWSERSILGSLLGGAMLALGWTVTTSMRSWRSPRSSRPRLY